MTDRLTRRAALISTALHAGLILLAIIGPPTAAKQRPDDPPEPTSQPEPTESVEPQQREDTADLIATPMLLPVETAEALFAAESQMATADPLPPLPLPDQAQGRDLLAAIEALNSPQATQDNGLGQPEGPESRSLNLPGTTQPAFDLANDPLKPNTGSAEPVDVSDEIRQLQAVTFFASMQIQNQAYQALSWRGRFRRRMTNTRPEVFLLLNQAGTRIRGVEIIAGRGTGVDELDRLIVDWFASKWHNEGGIGLPPVDRELAEAIPFQIRLE